MLLLALRGALLPLTVHPPAFVELFQLPPRMSARSGSDPGSSGVPQVVVVHGRRIHCPL